MFQKILDVIELNKNSEKKIWKILIHIKDFLYIKTRIFLLNKQNNKKRDTLILDVKDLELILKRYQKIISNYKYILIKNSAMYINDNNLLLEVTEFLNKIGFFEKNDLNDCENILFRKESEFNDDTILSKKIKQFIGDKNIINIVETGTYLGNTTQFFGKHVKNVYTVELNPDFLKKAMNRFDINSNINFYLGNSWEILDKEIIPKLKGDSLFFLDAHWGNPCPTSLELKVIAKHNIKPYILIHDFKVPDHPELGWDIYSDFEYNFENIKDLLDDIYGLNNYDYTYNNLATGEKRGIILISPKKA